MATKKVVEKKDGALPVKEEQTNIGDRNTASAEPKQVFAVEDEREPYPKPVPERDDYEIETKPRDMTDTRQADVDTIEVRGAVEPSRVAIAEVSYRHPGGQAYIVGTAEAHVAATQRVMIAIRDGKLVRK